MKLNKNTPNIFSKYQEFGLRAPSIEDGNISGDGIKGKILTSEISANEGYANDYTASIISVTSAERETGNKFSAYITIEYTVTIVPTATNPGYFGSDIIKENDPFVITSLNKDYVRGIISKITNVSFSSIGFNYTYTYTLLCALNQGDPVFIAAGENFVWKRQMFQDGTTYNEATPPSNISASFNKNTNDVYFYWDIVNQNTREHLIQIRESNVSDSPAYINFKVYGNTANSKTSIKPFVNDITTDISTFQILSPGEDMNSNRSIDIIGTGSGALWETVLDNNGSLMINEFSVYDAPIGSSSIFIYVRETRPEYSDYPSPNVNSFIEGLPVLGSTKNFYVGVKNVISSRQYELEVYDVSTGLPVIITPAWSASVINTKIKTHDGIRKINNGTGYNSTKIRANVKVIPDNVKAYWDSSILGVLPPGQTLMAWKVSSVYDEDNKNYTAWTEEDYIQT
jgi:hypothetical protein